MTLGKQTFSKNLISNIAALALIGGVPRLAPPPVSAGETPKLSVSPLAFQETCENLDKTKVVNHPVTASIKTIVEFFGGPERKTTPPRLERRPAENLRAEPSCAEVPVGSSIEVNMADNGTGNSVDYQIIRKTEDSFVIVPGPGLEFKNADFASRCLLALNPYLKGPKGEKLSIGLQKGARENGAITADSCEQVVQATFRYLGLIDERSPRTPSQKCRVKSPQDSLMNDFYSAIMSVSPGLPA